MAKGPSEGAWGWKKWTALLSVAGLIVFGPTLGLSSPAMDAYMSYCENHKGEDFSKWLHLKVAGICAKTLRPDRAADAYRKYYDWYRNVQDPFQDDEATYTAFYRCALETENDDRRTEGTRILQEWMETYGESHPFYPTVLAEFQAMAYIRPQ
jgi:hypothetical protein